MNLESVKFIEKLSNAYGISGFEDDVVATKPPHFMKEPITLQSIDEMVIDVGATSYEEVIKLFQIEIGAPVIPDAKFSIDQRTGIMLGKAFDNRLDCAAVLETLLALEGANLDVDIVGSISVQEEVGCREAKVNVNATNPDLAIVFEESPSGDTFMDSYDSQGGLKKVHR